MASAVSGYKRSFGSDGPPGCYGDFEHTHCLMAFGSNLPEQHPIIYWRLKEALEDRKSTRLNSSHLVISYAVFCLKKKITITPAMMSVSCRTMRFNITLIPLAVHATFNGLSRS